MSDTSNTPSSNETDTSADEVGRPDWSAREREEDPMAEWMQGDDFLSDTSKTANATKDKLPVEETSESFSSDFDMSRYDETTTEDLSETTGNTGSQTEDASAADASSDDNGEVAHQEDSAASVSSSSEAAVSLESTESTVSANLADTSETDKTHDNLQADADTGAVHSEDNTSEQTGKERSDVSPDDFTMDASFSEDSFTEVSEAPANEPVFLPEGDLPENWDAGLRNTVERWNERSTRHKGVEAFKTGLILPLLASLGYDVFNPDSIEPVEDESGRLDGYLAKSERGAFLVILDEADVPDDHREKVTMRTRRDRIAVGIRIPTEEGESRWQSVLDVEVSPDAALAGLRCVHHDIFDSAYIEHMARQVHGQQDDIIEAVRLVLTEPGRGFVEDVRERLVSSGHQDPIMLAERVSLAVARMLAGPDTAEEVEEDSKGRRELTPFENRAVELIREICAPQIDPSRIVPRPGQAYVAILLDDNNRRTIARLHFSAASKKYLGILTGNEENKEQIESTPDISRFSEALRARAAELDPEAF